MSVWLDGTKRAYPRLDGDLVADVAIVGAGIAGIASAYFLATAGVRVVVLEARGVAEAASGRNAGFLLAGVAENFVAASRRYGEERAWRIWRLTKRTQALARALVAEHRIECELRWNGSDQIAGDDEEWREVEESARRLAARGVAVTVDAARRAATYADDGDLHPVKWVRGLARAAVRAGARIHEDTTVTEIARGETRTPAGTVAAGAVVLCTNAYTARLVSSRVRPVRAQMLATAPTRPVFARPAYARRGYDYWRQTADGRVVVGGWRDTAIADEVGEDETPTIAIQSRLDDFLRAHGVDAPVTHRWAGTMGFSHDALPYVGQAGPRLFVCGGFTGHGMAFGPASAEIVAALVRDERHADADLFDPSR
ncbi:MAG TPA: FAD-dependent oxidoreductase [Candidatus Limnocylindria bacterium]|nr:FAD-dependent oxidoreductase [Candidatus Limnocylindria bacterium]